MKKKKQFKNTCVFCNEERKLSGEHIFPKWMMAEDILPKRQDYHYENNQTHDILGGIPDDNNKVYKQGYLGNKTKRIVCEVCNGGWMNDLQMKNKEILTALIKGEEIDLDKYSTAYLYAWIVMTSFMVSFASANRVMGRYEANRFYLSRHLPRNPVIYLGRYEGFHRIRRKNMCGNIYRVKRGVEQKQNAQIISMILGKLFIQFAYCTELGKELYVSQRFLPYAYLLFPPIMGPKNDVYKHHIIDGVVFKLIAERMEIEYSDPLLQNIIIENKLNDLYTKGD